MRDLNPDLSNPRINKWREQCQIEMVRVLFHTAGFPFHTAYSTRVLTFFGKDPQKSDIDFLVAFAEMNSTPEVKCMVDEVAATRSLEACPHLEKDFKVVAYVAKMAVEIKEALSTWRGELPEDFFQRLAGEVLHIDLQ